MVHDGSHSLYVGFGYDRDPVPHNDLYRYDLYERTWCVRHRVAFVGCCSPVFACRTLLQPRNGVKPPARINFRGWFYGDCVW